MVFALLALSTVLSTSAAASPPSVDLTGPTPEKLEASAASNDVTPPPSPARSETWMPTPEQILVALFGAQDEDAPNEDKAFRTPAVVVQSPTDRERGLELERQLAAALIEDPRTTHCFTSTDLAFSRQRTHAPEVIYDAARRKGATDVFIVRVFPNRDIMLVQRLSAAGVTSTTSMPLADRMRTRSDPGTSLPLGNARSGVHDGEPPVPPSSAQMSNLREHAFAFVPKGRTALLGPIRVEPFLVRTPDDKLLESEDALRAVGETELADRRGLATTSQPWLILGATTGLTALSIGFGVASFFLVASSQSSFTVDWLQPRAHMPVTAGALVGAGLGLPLLLAARFIPALLTPSEAEVQGAIRQHNLRAATHAGVDAEAIPFEYLGQ